jgi:threonine dehydrogenase-like Zn-dependent dehydrogenase
MQFSPDAIIQKGCTVVGAFGVDSKAYAEAISIIESGRFPLEKLHTHTFALAETARAIETLSGHHAGRIAVCVSVNPHL